MLEVVFTENGPSAISGMVQVTEYHVIAENVEDARTTLANACPNIFERKKLEMNSCGPIKKDTVFIVKFNQEETQDK